MDLTTQLSNIFNLIPYYFSRKDTVKDLVAKKSVFKNGFLGIEPPCKSKDNTPRFNDYSLNFKNVSIAIECKNRNRYSPSIISDAISKANDVQEDYFILLLEGSEDYFNDKLKRLYLNSFLNKKSHIVYSIDELLKKINDLVR